MDGVRPAAWYTERPGRWIAEKNGATTHLPVQTLHLGTEGTLGDAPQAMDADVTSPAHCGAAAGEYCAIWLGPEMPGDQRGDDALSSTFTSAPLDADMDLVGAPRLRLKLSSDKPQAQFAVRLNHIHPDGAATRITYGVLNLSHRTSAAEPISMPQNAREDITLDLDQIAYRIPAGHRIRVSISTAYWPLIWPAPEAAQLNITQGSIALPQRPTQGGDEVSFLAPEAAEPWNVEEIRPGNHIRRHEIDMVTGIQSLVIEDNFGELRDADHGLIKGSVARERWDIHPDDPLSARGECDWESKLVRDDIVLRTRTQCTMKSDATNFHLTAKIEAWENGTLIYTREESDTIPRDHM
jgi:hypothetical protein